MYKKFILSVICVLLLSSGSVSASTAPCPPKSLFVGMPDKTLSSNSECGSSTSVSETISTTLSLTQEEPVPVSYGPLVEQGSICPNIPTNFTKRYVVDSVAGFLSAYEKVMPGEAIVISNGSISWRAGTSGNGDQNIVLNKNGTEDNRIYILSEEMHGAKLINSELTFLLSGSFHTVSGFHIDAPNPSSSSLFILEGPNNRIACNKMVGGSKLYVRSTSSGKADNTEIDNNVFDANTYKAIQLDRCDPTKEYCTNNSLGIHIHHNTFSNLPKDENTSIDHEAIVVGLGYYPKKDSHIYNANGSNMETTIENNLFDAWNGEEELISVKSSRNIIRNNCVINAPNTVINIRLGDNNIITGNWIEGTNMYGFRVSGKGNHIVYNYVSRRGLGSQAFRLHQGLEYDETYSNKQHLLKYAPGSGNVFKFNVFNRFAMLLKVIDLYSTQSYDMFPESNLVDSNVLYVGQVQENTTLLYSQSEKDFITEQYASKNVIGETIIRPGELAASSCGNSALFAGDRTKISGNENLLSGADILPPAWW